LKKLVLLIILRYVITGWQQMANFFIMPFARAKEGKKKIQGGKSPVGEEPERLSCELEYVGRTDGGARIYRPLL
jgi:hypothetical protein